VKGDKYFWVHLTKSIAILMVVVLHVAAPYHYQLNLLTFSRWSVVNVYEAIVRPCVPLFFMVSGFLLLRFDEPVGVFFAKRVNKVLLPLMFWSLVYVLWMIYYGGQRYIDFGGVAQMLFFPVSYHLWFLYAIVGCYLFLPVLRKVTVAGNRELLTFYVCIWFFAMALLPLLQKYFLLKNQFDFSYATGFIGYFVLGYLLGIKDYSKWHAIFSGFLIVCCTMLTGYATSILTVKNGGILVADFTAVLSPSVIIASAGWFVLIKYMCSCFEMKIGLKLRSIVVSVSMASFGIYLVHVIILNLVVGFYELEFGWGSIDLIFLIPFLSTIVFVLSYVASVSIGKVVGLKKVVGR
jgi:surface polysaccharide O-acyltransferase-like enzyme